MFAWMKDPDISENLGLNHEPSLEKTVSWIQHALETADAWPYAVLLDGQHVGNVVFDQIDKHLNSARLSVYLGPPSVRGRGVGFTGMYLAIQEVFKQRSIHKIWLTVHARNHRAIQAYVCLGFQVEGAIRDGFLLRGGWLTALYMGLLKRDFPVQLPL
jgi:RimJ/RimL family protein N-acetyltransferase